MASSKPSTQTVKMKIPEGTERVEKQAGTDFPSIFLTKIKTNAGETTQLCKKVFVQERGKLVAYYRPLSQGEVSNVFSQSSLIKVINNALSTTKEWPSKVVVPVKIPPNISNPLTSSTKVGSTLSKPSTSNTDTKAKPTQSTILCTVPGANISRVTSTSPVITSCVKTVKTAPVTPSVTGDMGKTINKTITIQTIGSKPAIETIKCITKPRSTITSSDTTKQPPTGTILSSYAAKLQPSNLKSWPSIVCSIKPPGSTTTTTSVQGQMSRCDSSLSRLALNLPNQNTIYLKKIPGTSNYVVEDANQASKSAASTTFHLIPSSTSVPPRGLTPLSGSPIVSSHNIPVGKVQPMFTTTKKTAAPSTVTKPTVPSVVTNTTVPTIVGKTFEPPAKTTVFSTVKPVPSTVTSSEKFVITVNSKDQTMGQTTSQTKVIGNFSSLLNQLKTDVSTHEQSKKSGAMLDASKEELPTATKSVNVLSSTPKPDSIAQLADSVTTDKLEKCQILNQSLPIPMKITCVSETGDEITFSRDGNDCDKPGCDVTDESLLSATELESKTDAELVAKTDESKSVSELLSSDADIPSLSNITARIYLAKESEQDNDNKNIHSDEENASLKIGSVFSLNEDQKKEFFPDNNNDSSGEVINFELVNRDDVTESVNDDVTKSVNDDVTESVNDDVSDRDADNGAVEVSIKQEPLESDDEETENQSVSDVAVKQEPASPPPSWIKEEPPDDYQYSNYSIPDDESDDDDQKDSSDMSEVTHDKIKQESVNDSPSTSGHDKIKQEAVNDSPSTSGHSSVAHAIAISSSAPLSQESTKTTPSSVVAHTISTSTSAPLSQKSTTTTPSSVVPHKVVTKYVPVGPTLQKSPTALQTAISSLPTLVKSATQRTAVAKGPNPISGTVRDINGKKYIVLNKQQPATSAATGTVAKSYLITMSNGVRQLIRLPPGSPASSLLSAIAQNAVTTSESVKPLTNLTKTTTATKLVNKSVLNTTASTTSSWSNIKSVIPAVASNAQNNNTSMALKRKLLSDFTDRDNPKIQILTSSPSGVPSSATKNALSGLQGKTLLPLASVVVKPASNRPQVNVMKTKPASNITDVGDSTKPCIKLTEASEDKCPTLIKEEDISGRRRSSRERRLKRRYSPPPLGPMRKQRYSPQDSKVTSKKSPSKSPDSSDSEETCSAISDIHEEAKFGDDYELLSPEPLSPAVTSREDRMRLLKDLIKEKEAVLNEMRKKRELEKQMRETDPDLCDF